MQGKGDRVSVRSMLRLNAMIRLAALIVRLPLCIVGEVTDRLLGPVDPWEYKYSTTP